MKLKDVKADQKFLFKNSILNGPSSYYTGCIKSDNGFDGFGESKYLYAMLDDKGNERKIGQSAENEKVRLIPRELKGGL